jgi:hypothetical protein
MRRLPLVTVGMMLWLGLLPLTACGLAPAPTAVALLPTNTAKLTASATPTETRSLTATSTRTSVPTPSSTATVTGTPTCTQATIPPEMPSATLTPTATSVPTPLPVPRTSCDASRTSLCLQWSRMLAVGYADFNRDGREDVLTAHVSGTKDKVPIKMFLQTPTGRLVQDDSLFHSGPPGSIHARKIVIADFNRDTYPDAFVADHGFDQPPFPGAASILMVSNGDGKLDVVPIENMPVGFQHSATAADITGDGAPEIFVTDSTNGAFLMVNDGVGDFAITRQGIPAVWHGYYTAELIDLDNDGSYDLLVGGHEHEGAVTLVFWGDSTGTFTEGRSSRIPSEPDYRIVLDFDAEDLDGDGHRELVLTRTKSNPLYQGFFLQILDVNSRVLTDVSERIVPDKAMWEGDTAQWVAWIVIRDFNGDGFLDLVAPDMGCHLVYLNDGQGNFESQP